MPNVSDHGAGSIGPDALDLNIGQSGDVGGWQGDAAREAYPIGGDREVGAEVQQSPGSVLAEITDAPNALVDDFEAALPAVATGDMTAEHVGHVGGDTDADVPAEDTESVENDVAQRDLMEGASLFALDAQSKRPPGVDEMTDDRFFSAVNGEQGIFNQQNWS